MRERPGAARPSPAWYVAASFALAAPIVFLALPLPAALIWYHAMCVGATAAAAVLVYRSAAAEKRPWWCFVGGLGVFSARDVAMNWADAVPKLLVGLIDVVPIVVGYLLLCSATIWLVRVRAGVRDRDGLIDAAVVASSVATIVWLSVSTSHPGGGGAYASTAAHAILQALLISLAVRFMFTGAGTLPPAWLLFGATFFGFFGNVGEVMATQSVQIAPHNWIAAFWIVAWMCVPLAASHPRMAEVAAPAREIGNVSTARLLILGAALIGTPAVVLAESATTVAGRAAGAGSVIVTVLVLVRVVRLVRALEHVRLQQHTVLEFGQFAVRGGSVRELVEAATTALVIGLGTDEVRIDLDGSDADESPLATRREIGTVDEHFGSIHDFGGRLRAPEDNAFLDAVATTLSSAVARTRAEEQVRYWAMHDPLTALANRLLFSDRLELASARARRTASSLALLYIDIDGFKAVNDTLGHDVGDAVLIETARCLTDAVRATDTVARLSGDEFVVLCEAAADEADVRALAERLLAAVRVGAEAARGLAVSASIGVAFSDGFESSDGIIQRADRAMYAAKRAGRDRTEFAGVG